MKKQTIQDWKEEMFCEVLGTVFIGCVMDSVPFHPNTKRYHVYNAEGSYNEIYDITIDDDGYIVEID
jgi:hypothetical protein